MPESILRTTEWTVQAVSPVHIGAGDRLSPLDYATVSLGGKRLLVVYDFAALGVTDPARLQELLRFIKPGTDWQTLERRAKELGARDPRVAMRYSVPLLTRGDPEETVPLVRDADDRAYLPGSSLKGAIRTALLYGWAMRKPQQMREQVLGAVEGERRPRAEGAGRGLEKEAFGRDPNHDVMRALRVGDSSAVAGQGQLRRREAVVLATRLGSSDEEALRQWLEVVTAGAEVSVRVTLDNHLFGDQCERKLGFGRWKSDIENWPAACRRFSAALLERQAAMLERLGEAGADWCRARKAEVERDTAGCLLSVGWGVGWEGKTVGMLMRDDEYADVKAAYTLAKGKRNPEHYLEGVFPATCWGQRTSNGVRPFGWVRLQPK
ncbi:MAG TPA: type III-A CRISPR-associated RAMP protein Csm5 [Chthonomonadales bacterium]|nr:type III-A CRISPR-associated RAMP protein Csm5 [Chthonomonadales bacterium]